MDEFTDFNNINLQELSAEVLENFCDRYLTDASRVVNTGVILYDDEAMCKVALAIVIGLYFKNLNEGLYNREDRSIH